MNKFLKKFLHQNQITQIKQYKERFTFLALKVITKSNLLISMYYLLFSSAFRREQRSVLFGRVMYMENSLQAGNINTSYLLRRNIHRIEKGLLMRPRRNIFALDYISETVNQFVLAKNVFETPSASSTIKWAEDILLEYFKVVDSNPVIDKAHKIFLKSVSENSEQLYKPFIRELSKPVSVSYDEFLELSIRRRSIRWYLPKPVPRELLDKAISVAAQSPSACNRQSFEFRIFDDPETVQQIAQLPWGTVGFHHNIPVIVTIIGKLRGFFDVRDRHLIYIDGSLAAMSFMYALETLGLSSCGLNWPDVEEREEEAVRLLKLNPDERPILFMSVGYPDHQGLVASSAKKSLDEIRRYGL